jgi:hypothetical protein
MCHNSTLRIRRKTVLSKAMRRVERSAGVLKGGDKVLKFVRQPSVRKRLVKTARSGEPPITAISKNAIALLGKKAVRLSPIKQFIGLCVRAVLEEEGFEPARAGVRVYDPIFKRGSVYRRVKDKNQGPGASDILALFLRALNKEEAVRGRDILDDHIGRLNRMRARLRFK